MVEFVLSQILVHFNVHVRVDIQELDVKHEYISVQLIQHIVKMGLHVTRMPPAV